jgi:hypothetical protein
MKSSLPKLCLYFFHCCIDFCIADALARVVYVGKLATWGLPAANGRNKSVVKNIAAGFQERRRASRL